MTTPKPTNWITAVMTEENKDRLYDEGYWPAAEFMVDGGNKLSVYLWGPADTPDDEIGSAELAERIAALLNAHWVKS